MQINGSGSTPHIGSSFGTRPATQAGTTATPTGLTLGGNARLSKAGAQRLASGSPGQQAVGKFGSNQPLNSEDTHAVLSGFGASIR